MDVRTNGAPGASPVLVTGGTGTLGRHVVAALRDRGRNVRVLSRGLRGNDWMNLVGVEFVHGDLATGEGIEAALQGIEIIVHLAGTQKGDEVKARHLVQAAAKLASQSPSPASPPTSRPGIRHLVYISVVGADRVPVESALDRAAFGYFASKRGAERVIAESGLPWTTLRATQFHDLTFATVRAMARLPIVPVPAGMRFQPIDAAEVATRLVDLALGEPAGLVPEIGGPKVYDLADLLRSYLHAAGKRRLLFPAPIPGRAARAIRAGVNLTPDHAVGRLTWEEFLAQRLGMPEAGVNGSPTGHGAGAAG